MGRSSKLVGDGCSSRLGAGNCWRKQYGVGRRSSPAPHSTHTRLDMPLQAFRENMMSAQVTVCTRS